VTFPSNTQGIERYNQIIADSNSLIAMLKQNNSRFKIQLEKAKLKKDKRIVTELGNLIKSNKSKIKELEGTANRARNMIIEVNKQIAKKQKKMGL
jgi:hypothetical protein